jgi:hypothetical protein
MPPKVEPLALEGSATIVRRCTSATLLPPNETLLAPVHRYIITDKLFIHWPKGGIGHAAWFLLLISRVEQV